MARTLDALARFTVKEDGTRKDIHEATSSIASLTKLLHQVIQLNTNTVNYQVAFGSAFTTPTHLFLREQAGRSFTYSVNATNRHHLVAANGFAALHGSVASLRLSVSTTPTTRPTVEIVLCR